MHNKYVHGDKSYEKHSVKYFNFLQVGHFVLFFTFIQSKFHLLDSVRQLHIL